MCRFSRSFTFQQATQFCHHVQDYDVYQDMDEVSMS